MPFWYNVCAMALKNKNRIKFLRENQRLTQEHVGDELDVAHSTVQRWENGTRSFGVEETWALAKLFNCHPGEIFAEMPYAYGKEQERETERQIEQAVIFTLKRLTRDFLSPQQIARIVVFCYRRIVKKGNSHPKDIDFADLDEEIEEAIQLVRTPGNS